MAGKIISNQAKLRKYRDNLSICGATLIILGVWDILYVLIRIFDERYDLKALLEEDRDFIIAIILAFFLMVVPVAIAMVFRLYVGLGARAIADGKRQSWFYIVATFTMALWNLYTALSALIKTEFSDDPIKRINVGLSLTASTVLKITSLLILAEIIRLTILIAKMTGSMNAPTEDTHAG